MQPLIGRSKDDLLQFRMHPQRPSIAVENTLLEFGDVNKNDAKTQRVNIVYSGLTTNVALSVVGNYASAFSLSTHQ